MQSKLKSTSKTAKYCTYDMGIIKEVLVLLLLIIGSLAQSSDLICTVICDERCNLSDEMAQIKSECTLCLTPGYYSLENTTILRNISDVAIIGTEGVAVISCDTAVGMVIIDVERFQMKNITLIGCALTGDKWDQELVPMIAELINFTDIYYIPSAVGKSLTIIASHNVTLCHVDIRNSVGVGLLALNLIGRCYLLHCTFDNITDNNCSQSSNDLRCISGGAVFYLSDNKTPLSDDNRIIIDYCTFQNSISHSSYVAVELSDGIFNLNVSLDKNQSRYPLDGSAGLSVIMDRHYSDSNQYFIVSNSQFFNNFNFAAGCVLVQVTEYTTFLSINFNNNSFINCLGGPYGGAMFMIFGYKLQNSFSMASTSLYNSTIAIVGNLFENNSAVWGGGIAVIGAPGQLSAQIPKRSIKITDNMFRNNTALTGYALAIWESSSHGYDRIYGLDIHMHNNWFEDNTVFVDNSNFSTYNHLNTGTMYIDSSYVILTGNIVFYRNRGAILATRSVIEIKDTCALNITENIALIGAGADLRDGSFFVIKDNATITFHRNFSPLRGGGINLLNVRGWPLQFRDGCIFHFNEFSYCPDFERQGCVNLTQQYHQGLVRGHVIFDHNDAGILGKAMYGVQLLDCPWFQFDIDNFFEGLNSLNDTITFIPPLFSQTNVVNTPRVRVILKHYSPKEVMPGHLVMATINILDEVGDNAPSEVSLELDNQQNYFTIDGDSETFVIGNNSQINLRFFGTPNQTINFSLFSAQAYQLNHPASVYLTSCKLGFVFNNKTNSCICDPNLLQVPYSVSCTDRGTILVDRNLWAGALTNTQTGDVQYVVSLCYLQYCNNSATELQDLADTEVQCNFRHAGFLCGSCSNDFSDVFGSTRCQKCSNATIASILLFLFLGILLVGILLFGHITVSVGIFNGAVIYANGVSLYAYILYPNNYDPSNNPATVMVAWLNLNLGFELCFYNGMTSLSEVIFRLLFPIYLLFLLVAIIIVIRYTRFRLTRSPVPVLSTIIWLSYSSLFQTSVEILGVVPVTLYPSNERRFRWLQDPTVEYAHGGHLVLFFISLLLMIFVLVPLPFLLLFYNQLTNRFSWLNKIRPFVDAFYGPYKLCYYYWIGITLLFRMGLVVFAHLGQLFTISDIKQYFTLLTCFYVCGLLIFQAIIQPYKRTLVNLLDIFYLTNLTFLFMAGMYFAALGAGRDNSRDRNPHITHTSFSLGLTLIVFGVVLLWYLLGQLRNYLVQHTQASSKLQRYLDKKIFTLSGTFANNLLGHKDKEIPEMNDNRNIQDDGIDEDRYIQFRESLLSEDGI